MKSRLSYLAWIRHPHIRTQFWTNTRLLLIQHWMNTLLQYFGGHAIGVLHVGTVRISVFRRHSENVWRASGLEIHRQIYVDHRNSVSNETRKTKIQYYQNLLQDADQSAAFKSVDSLLNVDSSKLPDTDSMYNLCYQFLDFLQIKKN